MNDLSNQQRLLIIILLFSVGSLILARFVWDLTEMLSIAMFIIIILFITKSIWLPPNYGKTRVRLLSLGIMSSAYFFYPFWQATLKTLLINFFDQKTTDLITAEYASPGGLIAFLLLLVGVSLVNYLARDTSAMKEHPTPLEKEFPEKDYKTRLKSFCEVLRDDLRKLDIETQWSPMNFTPLDAEVEVRSEVRRVKKITDLLTAIKKAPKTDRTFLVLGDPGSGKSVALRKLCRDLLEEVDKTGKVPLYINLREWEITQEWSEKNPPTVKQLHDFVLKNLQDRLDIFGNDFLDTYFKRMFEDGRFFIVLDSFDEIPAVLDTPEGSWLIDKLSEVIYKFLAGAHQSRGILSSRIFRKPTDKFQTKTQLEIRPFTEAKIRQTLEKSFASKKEALIQRLFKERQDLMPVARNPFSAALISNYARNNDNALPQNQAELYVSYIEHQLKVRSCQERITKKGLTTEKVIDCSEAIANLMFNDSQLGLGAPMDDLKRRLLGFAVEDVVDILCYARLGRLGAGDDKVFSFAHRRFNEYFVSQQLIKNPERVPRESIPTDSRWRDALVLYCEVAEEEKAREIADYCWAEINCIVTEQLNMADPRYRRAVHSLRFLKEAFRARTTCLSNFRDELADFIEHQIKNAKDLVSKKLAVEAVGILEDNRIDSAITKALAIGNEWISETAFKACRHLPQLSEGLETRLRDYLKSSIDYCQLWKQKDEILFSLNLSDAFSSLHRMMVFKWWQIPLFSFLFLVLFIAAPLVAVFSVLVFIFYFIIILLVISIPICKLILFAFSTGIIAFMVVTLDVIVLFIEIDFSYLNINHLILLVILINLLFPLHSFLNLLTFKKNILLFLSAFNGKNILLFLSAFNGKNILLLLSTLKKIVKIFLSLIAFPALLALLFFLIIVTTVGKVEVKLLEPLIVFLIYQFSPIVYILFLVLRNVHEIT